MPKRSRAESLQTQLCENCNKIKELISKWQQCHTEDPSFRGELTCRLHDRYTQVESGAREGCPACQAIRRSLLQYQITWKAAEEVSKSNGAIDAKLYPRNEPLGKDFILEITLHCDPENPQDLRTVPLLLTENTTVGSQDLPSNSDSSTVIDQVREWVTHCHKDHQDCSNLQWSLKNPTHLIQILPKNELRLIDPPEQPMLKYAALSYSWGKRDRLSVDEVQDIEGAKTRRSTVLGDWPANINQRRKKFLPKDLPSAMRDAIKLTQRLGVEYIWIDQVCIGDAEDWNHEASKMHEVYGNSHFTICACSTEKATDGLFATRKAWDYAQGPCIIGNLQLVEYDMSLKDVRTHAPIFKRAWILQEERLSPRIIYWCSQRVYWSCLKCKKTEMTRLKIDGTTVSAEPNERKIGTSPLLQPQSFMNRRWRMEFSRLHEEWLDLVQDFTKRAIYDAADRFPAMSGLAAQYLIAFTIEQRVEERQEYLSGLWRETFAHDLTWTVERARNPFSKHACGPRWSWASLPAETAVRTKHYFQTSPHFELKEPSRVKRSDGVFEAVKRGADITAVRVKGRLRRFAAKDSTIAEWHDIVKSPDNDHEFKLNGFGMRNMVARHVERGKILSYEANRQEVTAQLDYAEDYGDLRDLWCLEVGKSSMLILVRSTKQRTIGVPSYIRIGAGHGFHEGFFFSSLKPQELDLVERQEPIRPPRLQWSPRWFLGSLFVTMLVGSMALVLFGIQHWIYPILIMLRTYLYSPG